MAEYLEREKLLNAMEEMCKRVCEYSPAQRHFMCGSCPLGSAFELVEEFPDEDVQPVEWIPVTERLPEEIGWYLVKVEAPYKPIRMYKYEPSKWYNDDDNLWRDGNGGDGYYVFNWFVTHWMPLPKPPKDGET